jgi:hypothetical protein
MEKRKEVMSIREQILAINQYRGVEAIIGIAADLAEARERELLERQAVMIEELRNVLGNGDWVMSPHIHSVINEYEVLK